MSAHVLSGECGNYSEFGIRCARCQRVVAATDWVRRARQLTYHLACFACDLCKRQLSTGEHFALQGSSRLLCKQHYLELIEGENGERPQIPCLYVLQASRRANASECAQRSATNNWRFFRPIFKLTAIRMDKTLNELRRSPD